MMMTMTIRMMVIVTSTVYRERVEMAQKCLEKEEEVTEARMAREEAEERAAQLQQKNRSQVLQNRATATYISMLAANLL